MPTGRINQPDGQSVSSASPMLALAMVEVLITCGRMGPARMEHATPREESGCDCACADGSGDSTWSGEFGADRLAIVLRADFLMMCMEVCCWGEIIHTKLEPMVMFLYLSKRLTTTSSVWLCCPNSTEP